MDYSPPGSSVHGISQARIHGVGCHFCKCSYSIWRHLDESWKWLLCGHLAVQENVMENLTIFSSSICFCLVPSAQIMTFLFTWQWEPGNREGRCSVIDTFFYWNLFHVLHGYRSNQQYDFLRRHLGLQQMMLENYFIKVDASFPTIISSFLEQYIVNNVPGAHE